jgi:hypothetical protein
MSAAMSPSLCPYGLILVCVLASCGGGEAPARYPAPPPPPPAPSVEPIPLPEPPPGAAPPGQPPPAPSASAQGASPPASQYFQAYSTGQWVYLSGQGWVWVPAGTAAVNTDGVPYAYLYTPAYGWTWYVSPWGWGPYFYGRWVLHPWHPLGLHGYWVARPGVAGRLGGGRR